MMDIFPRGNRAVVHYIHFCHFSRNAALIFKGWSRKTNQSASESVKARESSCEKSSHAILNFHAVGLRSYGLWRRT